MYAEVLRRIFGIIMADTFKTILEKMDSWMKEKLLIVLNLKNEDISEGFFGISSGGFLENC